VARLVGELSEDGRRAVVWGAGSKGVSFLNTLGARQISNVVDINPRKSGMYVSGTGHEVISPDRLANVAPEIVILMNANYRDEVAKTLDDLGLVAEILIG
jgi:hypothetical protein